jgi:hypothetical protein
MQDVLRSRGKIATGILINSIAKQIVSDTQINIRVKPYGKYVDAGRRIGAKQPPIKAIEGWCRIKGIPEEFAFVIARNIKLRGIKPVPFMNIPADHIDELAKLMGKEIAVGIVSTFKYSKLWEDTK